jgi:sugar phosphate isomerase/epimerase
VARPITLFTGQWADLPIEKLAPLAKEMGYDGLELACWGDHFEVGRALSEDGYVEDLREILESNGLECHAIGNHLVGQAVCDPIDERHRATLPPQVWGDGDPEGVRQRAAEEMKDTARAASRLGVNVVTGFTGSSIWQKLYFFPPTSQEVDEGYRDFSGRWNPILDVFDGEGVRFAFEVHSTEISCDIYSTQRAAGCSWLS